MKSQATLVTWLLALTFSNAPKPLTTTRPLLGKPAPVGVSRLSRSPRWSVPARTERFRAGKSVVSFGKKRTGPKTAPVRNKQYSIYAVLSWITSFFPGQQNIPLHTDSKQCFSIPYRGKLGILLIPSSDQFCFRFSSTSLVTVVCGLCIVCSSMANGQGIGWLM